MLENDDSSPLFSKLRKFINLIDQLRDVGVHHYVNLPKIAVFGTQSSGKSSVLEQIVGLDFLPRGEGVVTRRPLELRLVHIPDTGDAKPWATFEEVKGEKFFDFNKVREKIDFLTDAICGTKKNIVDKPIILNIYSPTCPDLTLIDLPGITRIPVLGSDMPKNIEEITKEMGKRYIMDKRTIILCVIPANNDITNSEALQMAQEIDPTGERTVGVLTKIDIMDHGTDAKSKVLGKEVPLKMGFVGVKCRSQQDINNKVLVKKALETEKQWFKDHPVYNKISPGYFGTDTLTQKLKVCFFQQIRQTLPEITREINNKTKECEDQLSILGQPLPVDDVGKLNLLWNLLSEYCESYKNILKGKYESKRLLMLKDEGGYKIKEYFRTLLDEYTGRYQATEKYSDEYINYALTVHEGDSIPGFPSIDAFYFLLKPKLEELREPIQECLSNVFAYMEYLSTKILDVTFQRFPKVIDDMNEFVTKFLHSEKDKAKYIVDSIVDMEISYLFTNDNDYLINYTTFIPKNQNSSQQKTEVVDSKNIFTREIRNRIEAYFKLVVRNLRDAIPKAIGYFLVKSIQENMQLQLYNQLFKSNEMVQVLNEPESVALERNALNNTLKVLKDAQKVLRRDPDIQSMVGSSSQGGGFLEGSSILEKGDKFGKDALNKPVHNIEKNVIVERPKEEIRGQNTPTLQKSTTTTTVSSEKSNTSQQVPKQTEDKKKGLFG
jgi:GTP-binding protein EngB required for normal cell division